MTQSYIGCYNPFKIFRDSDWLQSPGYFFIWKIHLFLTVLTKGGGRLGCSWSVTKSVIKHKAKPLKFVLPICFLSVEHKKRQSRFFTRPTPLVAQWLISHQNELHTPGIPFLTLLSFFTLPSQTVQTVDVRSIGVQFSIAMGLLCARDTPLNMSKTHFFFIVHGNFGGQQFAIDNSYLGASWRPQKRLISALDGINYWKFPIL